MSNHVRNNLFYGQGKFRVYDDIPRQFVMDLICDADDKPFYRQYSFFNKCFNCSYFKSLSSYTDFCSLSGFIAKYDDVPCSDFSPIKYSWFYRDYRKD